MKILHARVYGFGNWVDETVDFADASFVCIYGENETGKSTLQQFLLFMLFGLPPKLRTFYQPKTSGKMGGRLTILDSFGETFTIERLDQVRNGTAICYTETGEEHDEAWLRERLNGMTRATYQSIFSFSGLDLAGIKTMNEDDLGEVLLGIGLTGANNLHTLEKKLDKQMGDLFKRYGKKPVINQQLVTLDGIFSELKKQENQEAGYREKKSTIQVLKDDIASSQYSIQQERESKLTLEKQLQALPVLKDYLHYTEQLADYPTQINFPENGIERLQQLKEKLLPLKSEQSVLTDSQKKHQKKLEVLQQKLYGEAIYEEAEVILKGKQAYLENKRQMAQLQDLLHKQKAQIETELNQLDIGVSSDDLQGIAFPFHIEKTWNDLKNQHEQLSKEQEQLQQEKGSIQQQQTSLESQKQEKESEALSPKQKRELIEKIDTYEQTQYIRELQGKNDTQRDKWRHTKKAKQKQLTFIFTGSMITAILLAIIAGMTAISFIYSVSGLLMLAGIIQYLFGKHSLNITERLLYSEEQDNQELQITAEEKEKAERVLAKDRDLRKSLEMIQERINSNHIRWLQWEDKKSALTAKEKLHMEQVNRQVSDYPFLEQVRVNYWPELFLTLKYLLQLERQKNAYLASYEQIQQAISTFETDLSMFSVKVNQNMTDQHATGQIEDIERLLAEYQHSKSLISQYEKWLQEGVEQLSTLQQKMQVYEKEISALYQTAAVDNEEAFLQKASRLADKKEVEAKRDQLNYQLGMMLSEGAYWSLMEKETIDENPLQEAYEQKTAIMHQLEEEIAEKQQQLASVQADVANMEASGRYSQQLHRFTMEQEHLKQLAEEWAVLKTAKEMLAETKRDYREKYLNKVIDRTAVYFSALTDSHYIHVFAPSMDRSFQVEARSGIRYEVHELSQGTVDQLYVSLRLAISEIMSMEHRLPFMIDDAFVHFDAHRTRKVINILADHATEQQMIIFTCKQEIAEIAKTAKVIALTHNL